MPYRKINEEVLKSSYQSQDARKYRRKNKNKSYIPTDTCIYLIYIHLYYVGIEDLLNVSKQA